MTLIFICYLVSSHLKCPVISQGRRAGLQITARGAHVASFTRCFVPTASPVLGTTGQELSLSLAGSEFIHLTPCCSAKVCSGAQDCTQADQTADAANWMMPVSYLWSSVSKQLVHVLWFPLSWSGWREVTCSDAFPLKHSAAVSRWSFVRAVLYSS